MRFLKLPNFLQGPQLTDSEMKTISRAREVHQKVAQCRKRFQSMTSLAHSSPEDALFLGRHLIVDIATAFAAMFEATKDRDDGMGDDGYVTTISQKTDRLLKNLAEQIELVSIKETADRNKLHQLIPAFRLVVERLETEFETQRNSTLSTRDDTYRKRLFYMSGLVIAIGALVWVGNTVHHRLQAADYDNYSNAGFAALLKRDFEKAVSSYEEAVRALPNDPKSAEGYNNLGWSLYKLGRDDDAIAAFEQSLRLKPNWSMARNNLQLVKNRQNKEQK